MSGREMERSKILAWYALMMNAETFMTAAERAELHEWEECNLDGHRRSSDWPGWSRFSDLDQFWPWPQQPRPDQWSPEPPRQPPHPIKASGRGVHVIYRLWDDDDLLYIGVSSNLAGRLTDHRKRWAGHEVTWVEYGSRAEAELAEAEAIRTESPIWNVQGR